MTNIFRGFAAVFYKEVLHVRRDAATLFFSLIIPLLQMTVLGFAIDTNIRQVHTVVYNADGRQESRELLDRLKNSDTFHIIRYVENDKDDREGSSPSQMERRLGRMFHSSATGRRHDANLLD